MPKGTTALLLFQPFAHAQRNNRPIVYAARYYYPPGEKPERHSYFHLYRINPDGSGRQQLTFGKYDDSLPRWSPDGKKILFLRYKKDGRISACLLHLAVPKAKPRVLFTGKFGSVTAFWSKKPNTAIVMVKGDNGSEQNILFNTRTGKEVRRLPGAFSQAFSPDETLLFLGRENPRTRILRTDTGAEVQGSVNQFSDAVWRDAHQTLIGWPVGERTAKSAPLLRISEANGKNPRTLRLLPTAEAKKHLANEYVTLQEFRSIDILPGEKNAVLVYGIAGNSTYGHWRSCYRVDLPSGKTTYWGEAGFEFSTGWSPDSKRFCTSLRRDYGSYGKRDDGSRRTVEVSPLYVASTRSPNKRKAIVSGLVMVNGCDWRPLSH
jgi:hypothetical protein